MTDSIELKEERRFIDEKTGKEMVDCIISLPEAIANDFLEDCKELGRPVEDVLSEWLDERMTEVIDSWRYRHTVGSDVEEDSK